MTTGELYKHVNEFCDVAGGTSNSALQRAVQKDMGDEQWTWKKLTVIIPGHYSFIILWRFLNATNPPNHTTTETINTTLTFIK
jgi:hypothetical protein